MGNLYTVTIQLVDGDGVVREVVEYIDPVSRVAKQLEEDTGLTAVILSQRQHAPPLQSPVACKVQ